MKKCNTCLRELSEENFYKRENKCKKCRNIKLKEWSLKNKEKIAIHAKKSREKRKHKKTQEKLELVMIKIAKDPFLYSLFIKIKEKVDLPEGESEKD